MCGHSGRKETGQAGEKIVNGRLAGQHRYLGAQASHFAFRSFHASEHIPGGQPQEADTPADTHETVSGLPANSGCP